MNRNKNKFAVLAVDLKFNSRRYGIPRIVGVFDSRESAKAFVEDEITRNENNGITCSRSKMTVGGYGHLEYVRYNIVPVKN